MSVTAASGFIAGGVSVGIKPTGALDLALVVAEDGPIPTAGLFTRNRAAAPPVTMSRARLRSGSTRAVVLNSGCANAGTGAPRAVDPDRLTIGYQGVIVAKDAGGFPVDIDVGDGPGVTEVITTDLTPDYVRCNGEPS